MCQNPLNELVMRCFDVEEELTVSEQRYSHMLKTMKQVRNLQVAMDADLHFTS